jgi:TolB protein
MLAISAVLLSAIFSGCSKGLKGMIVYAGVAGPDQGVCIYAVSPDGKTKKQLTPSGDYFRLYPAVSPDGKHVVFSSSDNYKLNLYIMDSEGKNMKKIAETANEAVLPSWSPDGKQIAFLDRHSDHTTAIYLVNPDGTNLHEIVSGCRHHDDYQYAPLWSRDGKTILYDKINPESEAGHCRMYVINTDGSGEAALAGAEQARYDGDWSPDGKKIVYYSEKTEVDYNRSDNSGIFVMNPDGTDEKFLTAGYRPVWSPDGAYIAFTAAVLDMGNCVLVMFPDGTGPGVEDDGEDGEYYSGEDEGEVEAKGVPLPVSFDGSPGVKDPVWSPDGKKIAFVTDTAESNDNTLWVADVEGNSPVALAKNVVGRSRPSWR